MGTISDLNQTAKNEDTVSPAWVNNVAARILAIEKNIGNLSSQANEIRNLLIPFSLSIVSNTAVSYRGGQVMLSSRNTLAISAGTLEINEDGTSVIYIDPAGQVLASLDLPLNGYEIGLATRENGRLVSVQNFPPARITNLRQGLVTFDDLEPLIWHRVSSARLTTPQPFRTLGNPPYTDRYLVVGFNSVEYSQTTESGFTGFNDAGEFTTSEVGKTYAIHAQIRLTGQPNQNLSGKISAFVTGQGELEIALAQAESANGDLVLNGQNALPVGISPGDIATVQAYLTEGDGDVIINRGSAVTIWEVPDNSSLIPIQ